MKIPDPLGGKNGDAILSWTLVLLVAALVVVLIGTVLDIARACAA